MIAHLQKLLTAFVFAYTLTTLNNATEPENAPWQTRPTTFLFSTRPGNALAQWRFKPPQHPRPRSWPPLSTPVHGLVKQWRPRKRLFMNVYLLNREVSRSLGGKCAMSGEQVRAKNGDLVSDCSACRLDCGDASDLGIAAKGVRLTKDWRGLWLIWSCPSCSAEVCEQTEMFWSSEHADRVLADPLCSRCRT